MAVKTQGTNLYFIDPAGNTVKTVGCTTSISGISASRAQIDVTCLESLGMEYDAGMPDPGTATFGVNFDPQDPSHLRLHQLFTAGTKVQWALGWGDGVAEPVGVNSDGNFNLPTTRTWITAYGYPSDVPFDFSLNSVVKSSVSVQLSGLPVLVPRAASS
ncbi:phage tail tube protein [uncultured Gilvimarinus sp.]|uniref:phage tail tube protein n=1 Tax=uncultured Gilvimarinus sp. TaxID=1689143 RepID=UPI0030DC726F